jgi:hypothetical protein
MENSASTIQNDPRQSDAQFKPNDNIFRGLEMKSQLVIAFTCFVFLFGMLCFVGAVTNCFPPNNGDWAIAGSILVASSLIVSAFKR